MANLLATCATKLTVNGTTTAPEQLMVCGSGRFVASGGAPTLYFGTSHGSVDITLQRTASKDFSILTYFNSGNNTALRIYETCVYACTCLQSPTLCATGMGRFGCLCTVGSSMSCIGSCLNIAGNVIIGAGGTGPSVKVRHIDGKCHTADTPDTLYLQYNTAKNVTVGRSACNANLCVYGSSIATNLCATSRTYYGSNSAAYIHSNGNYLRHQNAHGYIQFGPENSSWAHISTDRNRFYFNCPIAVNGGDVRSYDENLVLSCAGGGTARIVIGSGTTTSCQKMLVCGCVQSPILCATSTITSSGTVGGVKLCVDGSTGDNASPRGEIAKHVRWNYAPSSCWRVSTTGNNSQCSPDGLIFSANGDCNRTCFGIDPWGRRSLIWHSYQNDTNSGADGGWNKSICNLDPKRAYLSVIYFKKLVAGNNSGTFYHGTGTGTNNIRNIDGSANTNPYFMSTGLGSFEEGQWYVSVGYIVGCDDTSASYHGGVYRLCDGTKTQTNSTYRMGSSTCLSNGHRVFLYYSDGGDEVVQWWGPGFYEMNGMEPSFGELLNGNPAAHNKASNIENTLKIFNVCGSNCVRGSVLYGTSCVATGSTPARSHIKKNASYDTLELVGYGNEMMIGSGGTNLHINYRCAGSGASTTPTNWYWRAGTSTNFSNHYFGVVCSCSVIKSADWVCGNRMCSAACILTPTCVHGNIICGTQSVNTDAICVASVASISGDQDYEGLAVGQAYSNEGGWNTQLNMYGRYHDIIRIKKCAGSTTDNAQCLSLWVHDNHPATIQSTGNLLLKAGSAMSMCLKNGLACTPILCATTCVYSNCLYANYINADVSVTTPIIAGTGSAASGYGAIQVTGNKNNWGGIHTCGFTFMADCNCGAAGIYNDTDDEWAFYAERNGSSYMYYNGIAKGQALCRGFRACGQTTGCGYLDLCPNGSWGHLITDRSKFYANKPWIVDTGCVGSYDENLTLHRGHANSTAAERIVITSGTTHICQLTKVHGNLCVTGTVTADGMEGDTLVCADCCTGTICFNTSCVTGLDAVYDIYVSANPNCGGSTSYRDIVHLTSYVTTGYSGSAVTKYINTINKFTRDDLHGSGGSTVTATAKLLVGTTGADSYAVACATCLQVQVSGGAHKNNTCVIIKKVL